MTSYRYDRHTGRMIPKELLDHPTEEREAWVTANPKDPNFVPAAPMVISDDLGKDGVLNHADGKLYDSKSEYYGAVKAAGCEVVGNDKPDTGEKKLSRRERKQDIADAMNQLGY